MGISQYIKEIGRGKEGARSLSRDQAADLFGQVLDGSVTDLEIGGFCLAMRIKGETPTEMAGFLDATAARIDALPASDRPLVVLPSYNGARKLPVLTPLLALLLAREGLPVLLHGTATESQRVFVPNVLTALDLPALSAIRKVANGEVAYAATELLCPGLKRLLDVRRVVGLRNPAHSLVKLMSPCAGASLVVSSYTHPEYAVSMGATFSLMKSHAMLLRGTEGEVVADPRRLPQMTGFLAGESTVLQEAQAGPLAAVPELPKDIDADTTARYIQDVLAGRKPVPTPIARQVALLLRLTKQITALEAQTA
ncbi:DNA-binding protein YbiB [Rhodoferax koreense]|uniref:DNA-binding protein YbiB n=1 Tax=Rhodoferax koreensis TaxID=1842727 RepID=A0A1P8JY20_9BURK|nr:DNA-binding protein YbiB [Rhodoferax koreense]APW38581.1 DNA-binding protein YbiB [Rhodoferax koreense]